MSGRGSPNDVCQTVISCGGILLKDTPHVSLHSDTVIGMGQYTLRKEPERDYLLSLQRRVRSKYLIVTASENRSSTLERIAYVLVAKKRHALYLNQTKGDGISSPR